MYLNTYTRKKNRINKVHQTNATVIILYVFIVKMFLNTSICHLVNDISKSNIIIPQFALSFFTVNNSYPRINIICLFQFLSVIVP